MPGRIPPPPPKVGKEKDKKLELKRRDLWLEIFVASFNLGNNSKFAAEEANQALSYFDKTFTNESD